MRERAAPIQVEYDSPSQSSIEIASKHSLLRRADPVRLYESGKASAPVLPDYVQSVSPERPEYETKPPAGVGAEELRSQLAERDKTIEDLKTQLNGLAERLTKLEYSPPR